LRRSDFWRGGRAHFSRRSISMQLYLGRTWRIWTAPLVVAGVDSHRAFPSETRLLMWTCQMTISAVVRCGHAGRFLGIYPSGHRRGKREGQEYHGLQVVVRRADPACWIHYQPMAALRNSKLAGGKRSTSSTDGLRSRLRGNRLGRKKVTAAGWAGFSAVDSQSAFIVRWILAADGLAGAAAPRPLVKDKRELM